MQATSRRVAVALSVRSARTVAAGLMSHQLVPLEFIRIAFVRADAAGRIDRRYGLRTTSAVYHVDGRTERRASPPGRLRAALETSFV